MWGATFRGGAPSFFSAADETAFPIKGRDESQ
jgi:hypothetical protein